MNGNIIIPFKGRYIDDVTPVEIYRNVTRKGKIYSIRQFGKVVAHTSQIMLRDVEFIVNKKGIDRIRQTGRKEIVAYAKGFITNSGMGTTADRNDLPCIIEFNPFKCDYFVCRNLTVKPFKVKGAWIVIFNREGVKASYTYKP